MLKIDMETMEGEIWLISRYWTVKIQEKIKNSSYNARDDQWKGTNLLWIE